MTYYIYHIAGVKIGCTINPKKRVREQSFDSYSILEEHTDVYIASDREQELQKQYGYPVDIIPYWKTIKMPTFKSRSKGGKISGKKNVESGHLASIRTFESRSKGGKIGGKHHSPNGGKIQGKKNVESGHLALMVILAAEKRSIPILAFNYLTGELISKYKSISEAGRELNIFGTNINCCLKGKYKQAKGYTFKYA
jgi:hypothetical protein